MKSKIIIIGHAGFPNGIKSSLEFICGFEQGVESYHIDDDNHESTLKEKLSSELQDQSKLIIIFADLPGGSPHQMAVQMINEKKLANAIVIAGAGFSFIMDLAMKALLIGVNSANEMQEYIESKMKNLKQYLICSYL